VSAGRAIANERGMRRSVRRGFIVDGDKIVSE